MLTEFHELILPFNIVPNILCVFPPAGQSNFTMSEEQEVYQAEEKSNITITWLLHFHTNRPPDFLQIDLMNVKRKTRVFFYNSETGTEVYPDEHYRGRLQCDPQLARKGRLECVLTDLRLNDTGTYHCIVVLNEEVSFKTCDLNVTGKMTSLTLLLVSITSSSE